MLVKNKLFVVTGAGNGIGKELTLSLIQRGARVAAVDLNNEALKELKQLVDKDCLTTHVLDITNKKAVELLPSEILSQQGSIDGLINNAGIIQPFVKVNDLDYETINKVMDINFFGTLQMTKTFLPILVERPEAYIANVSSMGGFLPVPGQSLYGASKAAVKLFTEGLFAELKNSNVKVSIVFPGATATNIAENSGLKKLTEPENKKQNFKMLPAKKTAEIIINGIEKNKFQIFTGNDSKLMNFLYRLSPVFATNLIAKQMKSLLK